MLTNLMRTTTVGRTKVPNEVESRAKNHCLMTRFDDDDDDDDEKTSCALDLF